MPSRALIRREKSAWEPSPPAKGEGGAAAERREVVRSLRTAPRKARAEAVRRVGSPDPPATASERASIVSAVCKDLEVVHTEEAGSTGSETQWDLFATRIIARTARTARAACAGTRAGQAATQT